MKNQKYYDSIIDDTNTYDKVLMDLEQMSNEAPNPRIRTAADRALADLKLVIEISKALREDAKRQNKI